MWVSDITHENKLKRRSNRPFTRKALVNSNPVFLDGVARNSGQPLVFDSLLTETLLAYA